MNNYYRYLPVSKRDEEWGLCVLNTGCTHIPAQAHYPAASHPSPYYYEWRQGRVLQEYQVIYITRGSGLFESASCARQTVKAGSMILLFPGELHRYKPDEVCGWDEYWIGCKGAFADGLVQQGFFQKSHPCLFIGFQENILHLFTEIIEAAKYEEVGYQAAISGAAIHLLGKCYSLAQKQAVANTSIESLMSKARLLLRAGMEDNCTPESVARELQVSYSFFRKAFKTHTHLSPGQYLIQLRIEHAKKMLAESSLPVKEIAYHLHFSSYHYFSRLFKEKTGLSPVDFRQSIQHNY